MRTRIFTCHHVAPEFIATNELFAMLVSGLRDAPDGSYLGDLGGENIAAENIYTDLRHPYFIWKNHLSEYDYVGFEHYRRMWFIDPMPAARLEAIHPDLLHFRSRFQSELSRPNLDISPDSFEAHYAMRRAFLPEDIAAFSGWLSGCDIVIQRPETFESIEWQWRACQNPEHWPIIVESIRQSRYYRERRPLIDFRAQSASWNNMSIMRADLFGEYMTFLWDCIGYLREHMAPWHRAWGHCAERIFNFWLFQKVMDEPMLRVQRMPYLMRTPALVAPLPN